MAWSTPSTYAVGSLLTATLMNNISGDLSDLDSRTRPAAASVSTNQATSFTTYTDLATAGHS